MSSYLKIAKTALILPLKLLEVQNQQQWSLFSTEYFIWGSSRINLGSATVLNNLYLNTQ